MVMFVLVSLLVFAVDQVFKYLIRASLCPSDVVDTFLPFLKITYVKNTGAAFGSMAGMQIFLIIFSVLVIVFVIYYIFKKNIKNRYLLIPIALALGGALSNLYDRIFYGFVTDYIKVMFFRPVCNIADYCICVGTALVLIFILKNGRSEKS